MTRGLVSRTIQGASCFTRGLPARGAAPRGDPMLEPRVVPKGENLVDLEVIQDRLFEGERFKPAAELRAGAAASVHVRITDASPGFLPFDLGSAPELARFIQVPDPHRYVVLVADVEVRATFDLSLVHELASVRMHCVLRASNGTATEVAMRQVLSRQAPETRRSTWIGLAPLELSAESYAHQMVLEVVSRRFDGHVLRRAWTSPVKRNPLVEGLRHYSRERDGRWRGASEAELRSGWESPLPLDGSERVELQNTLDEGASITAYHPMIATPSGLLWHQAQISVRAAPALPQWVLAADSAARLSFSCASVEERVPRGVVLLEQILRDGNLRSWPFLVPLIDESWPEVAEDLVVSQVHYNGRETRLASSTRPIAPALVTDSTNATLTLRIRNGTDHDVRLISVEKAAVQSIGIPRATIDALHQTPGCLDLDEVPVDHAPTLPAGGTLDVQLRRTGAGFIFVLVSARKEDVPGASGILIPVRFDDQAP